MPDGSQLNPPNPKQRYGDAKPNTALVPSSALVYLALALGEGARKYGPYNWRERSVEAGTYIAAAERHMRAWYDGEDIDQESGKPHLAHALACLAILVDAIETPNCLIDNRPKASPTAALIRAWTTQEVSAPKPELNKTPCACKHHRCLIDDGVNLKYAYCRRAEQELPEHWADHQNEPPARLIPRHPTQPVGVSWGHEDPGDTV